MKFLIDANEAKQGEGKYVTLVDSFCSFCSLKNYPNPIIRANAAYCLTQINFFAGQCKQETAQKLLQHETNLIDARDNDELNEIDGYLNQIS